MRQKFPKLTLIWGWGLAILAHSCGAPPSSMMGGQLKSAKMPCYPKANCQGKEAQGTLKQRLIMKISLGPPNEMDMRITHRDGAQIKARFFRSHWMIEQHKLRSISSNLCSLGFLCILQVPSYHSNHITVHHSVGMSQDVFTTVFPSIQPVCCIECG